MLFWKGREGSNNCCRGILVPWHFIFFHYRFSVEHETMLPFLPPDSLVILYPSLVWCFGDFFGWNSITPTCPFILSPYFSTLHHIPKLCCVVKACKLTRSSIHSPQYHAILLAHLRKRRSECLALQARWHAWQRAQHRRWKVAACREGRS